MSTEQTTENDYKGALFALPTDAYQLTSDDCYTPRWIFDAMGLHFDLDVAAPPGGPWHVPCDRYYTAEDDGIAKPWEGTIWCNPPYSKVMPWATLWAQHERGVFLGAYVPETRWTGVVMRAADCVAFISAKFTTPDGGLIKPRQGLLVAFRGVGTEPAERLAAVSSPLGAVLYGGRAA